MDNSFLSDILNNKTEIDEKSTVYTLNFTQVETKPSRKVKHETLYGNEDNDFKQFEQPKVSERLEDYYRIEPEHAKHFEELGSENSLFLAVARAILYKMYFEDLNYRFIIKHIYFKTDEIKLDSDNHLQRLIRKKLCTFWLSKVQSNLFNSSRYKK